MNESGRTITYVVVAAVAVGLAFVLSPPGEITPESLRAHMVGEPFFKDFNPGDATSIRVIGYDEAKATSRSFGVKFQNGKWSIPSHHNYPADGADRLAKTAASARGIKREELASSSAQNHEQLAVIDPLDEDKTKLKGRGQRITLNKDDDVLVDLIVGKQVKDRPGFFYIRKPGEDATYVAKVSIDLSTKFADWVETDLLKIDKNDLTEIVVNNYKSEVDGGRLVIAPGENNTLIREKSTDPWKLEGLEESTEEVDVSKVNAMLGALDDLKLVGVRPKPKGFKPDLTIDPEFVKRQADLNQLVLDLQSRGYILVPDRKNNALKLYADEGELTAATNKGVVYTLKFGSVFLGDESEIEIGAAAGNDKAGEKSDEEEAADDKDKAKVNAGKQSSRYLFVTVDFDEKHLGTPPQKPTPPEEVAQATESKAKPGKGAAKKESLDDDADTQPQAPPKKEAADKKSDEQSAKDQAKKDPAARSDAGDENCFPRSAIDDDADAADVKKSEKSDDEKAGDDAKPDDKSGDEAPDADAKSKPAPPEEKKKSADDLKKEYDAQVKKYESDLKVYEDKVTAGKKLVNELNARFSGWYYVISAENFNKLHLSRKELVKEKGKPGDDKKEGTPPGTVDEEMDDATDNPRESDKGKSEEESDENEADEAPGSNSDKKPE